VLGVSAIPISLFHPEAGGSRALWIIDTCLPNYMQSLPKRHYLKIKQVAIATWDTQCSSWSRHWATSWKLAGLIPNGVRIFH
jgi:hypothetical protein